MTEKKTKLRPKKCPSCGSAKVLPILWGMPRKEDLEATVEPRDYVLGGCLISPGAPTWFCDVCEHRWGKLRIGE